MLKIGKKNSVSLFTILLGLTLVGCKSDLPIGPVSVIDGLWATPCVANTVLPNTASSKYNLTFGNGNFQVSHFLYTDTACINLYANVFEGGTFQIAEDNPQPGQVLQIDFQQVAYSLVAEIQDATNYFNTAGPNGGSICPNTPTLPGEPLLFITAIGVEIGLPDTLHNNPDQGQTCTIISAPPDNNPISIYRNLIEVDNSTQPNTLNLGKGAQDLLGNFNNEARPTDLTGATIFQRQ